MTTTTQEQLEGLGTYKFGWADSDVAGESARRGLSEEVVRDISARKNEPEWILDMRLKGLKYFGRKPHAELGCRSVRHRLRQHQVLRAVHREAGRELGRAARRYQEHLRQARHPRGGKAAGSSPAWPPSTSPRSSTTRSGKTSRKRASSSWTRTRRSSEHPDLFREYFGTVIPPGDNKFAALNTRGLVRRLASSTCRKGVKVRHPAAGLFPHQHREHGPVRADPDHRRRGRLRPLRRRLHRARFTSRTRCTPRWSRSSSRRTRAVRYTTIQNWSNNVYNLVTKRAIAHAGRDDGVGRRQHRLQADDEVPGGRT